MPSAIKPTQTKNKRAQKLLGKRKFSNLDSDSTCSTASREKETEQQNSDLSVMINKAWKVRQNAYCPYSGFQVGACLKSKKTGKLYVGCNVENAAYPSGICAERGALMTMIAAEGP